MPTRIERLTPEQEARFDEWADRWIAIGLNTEPADRPRFEDAARACYRFAGLADPLVIVWCPSPLVVALAGPAASDALARLTGDGTAPLVREAVSEAVARAVNVAVAGAVDEAVAGAVEGAVYRAVNVAVAGAVSGAVSGAVTGSVTRAVDDAVTGAVDDAVGGAVDDAVGGAVSGAVSRAVEGAVYRAVDRAVNVAVSGAVSRAVEGAVYRAVDRAVNVAVNVAVGGAVSRAVDDAVGRAVEGAVYRAVDVAVGGAVSGAVSGAVTGSVTRAVDDAVTGAVDDAVGGAVDDDWRSYIGGQFWAGGWYWTGCWTSFFREIAGLDLAGDLWDRARSFEATTESACWWWPHRRFIMVSERPHVISTERIGPRGLASHRLHAEDGPAVGWQDWGVYAWHGVRVPAKVIEAPDTLTLAEIQGEPNVEVRRVMVERFGAERYLRQSRARTIHEDTDGLGHPRRLLRLPQAGDEPLVMVEVTNSTPEPDGTFRRYMLRVPPGMTTCHEAVAWTFNATVDEYRVAVET